MKVEYLPRITVTVSWLSALIKLDRWQKHKQCDTKNLIDIHADAVVCPAYEYTTPFAPENDEKALLRDIIRR